MLDIVSDCLMSFEVVFSSIMRFYPGFDILLSAMIDSLSAES